MKAQTLLCIMLVLIGGLYTVIADPVGPEIIILDNYTGPTNPNGTWLNLTGTDPAFPDDAGGHMYTLDINITQQNINWKAYVGNLTAYYVLADSNNDSLFTWRYTVSSIGGVYATRSSESISWGNISCGTAENITREMFALNHTDNPIDNISATFDGVDNQQFYVGSVLIAADTCATTNLYVNSTEPINDTFEQVLLHDGESMVYGSLMENDEESYRFHVDNQTYDFQIMVPEVAWDGWDAITLYYFYSELV